MANYNTFVVVDCKSKKSILTTSSAKLSYRELCVGIRIEVWNGNEKAAVVYDRTHELMKPYLEAEHLYIREKQRRAEQRNAARKRNREGVRAWQGHGNR